MARYDGWLHLGPALLELPDVLEADQAAEPVEGIELGGQRIARTRLLEHAVDPLQRLGGGEEAGHRKDGDPVAQLLQPRLGQDRRAPAVRHVGEQRHIEVAADARHLLLALGALDEENVGARPGVGLAAAQRLVEAEAGARVGPGDDEKVGRGAAGRGHLDLAHHLVDGHHAPARGMPAPLGEHLVLDLDRGRAGRLVALDRALQVEQTAKAGIGIADDRRRRPLADLGDAPHHLGVADEAGVGQPERGRHAVARHVERLEPQPVRDFGGNHVVDAGSRDQPLAGQRRPQPRSRMHGSTPSDCLKPIGSRRGSPRRRATPILSQAPRGCFFEAAQIRV